MAIPHLCAPIKFMIRKENILAVALSPEIVILEISEKKRFFAHFRALFEERNSKNDAFLFVLDQKVLN